MLQPGARHQCYGSQYIHCRRAESFFLIEQSLTPAFFCFPYVVSGARFWHHWTFISLSLLIVSHQSLFRILTKIFSAASCPPSVPIEFFWLKKIPVTHCWNYRQKTGCRAIPLILFRGSRLFCSARSIVISTPLLRVRIVWLAPWDWCLFPWTSFFAIYLVNPPNTTPAGVRSQLTVSPS